MKIISENKFIILIIISLITIVQTNGQTDDLKINYYKGKNNKILSIDNQQYLIQSRQLGGYEFGNINNTKLHINQYLPDGTLLRFEDDKAKEASNYRVKYTDVNKVMNVIKSIFTNDEINEFKLNDDYLHITAVIDMNGNILETAIILHEKTKLCYINPKRLVDLEQKLKKQVKFIVMDSIKTTFNLDFVKRDIILYFKNSQLN
ncbi:MAG: hypothetical protein LBF04_04685 [Prevotellaceae bacterium]|jgi:hypothetical protein|nr:hypothetical protein [Prevotellaceae bacterium]